MRRADVFPPLLVYLAASGESVLRFTRAAADNLQVPVQSYAALHYRNIGPFVGGRTLAARRSDMMLDAAACSSERA